MYLCLHKRHQIQLKLSIEEALPFRNKLFMRLCTLMWCLNFDMKEKKQVQKVQKVVQTFLSLKNRIKIQTSEKKAPPPTNHQSITQSLSIHHVTESSKSTTHYFVDKHSLLPSSLQITSYS